jgi:hypothetical protein
MTITWVSISTLKSAGSRFIFVFLSKSKIHVREDFIGGKDLPPGPEQASLISCIFSISFFPGLGPC